MRALRRLLLLCVVAVAALVPATALALDECRGLQECVSVVGPWVVVPASADGGLVAVDWELRCPLRGYVVGGTDARVTSSRVEVSIRGEKGSPVSPGVTTRRALTFTARRAAGEIAAFLPAIGCLPSDGGGGRSQTAVRRSQPVLQPGTALQRRVAIARIPAGARRIVVASCPKGTRRVAASHAVGFVTTDPPVAAVLGSVRTTAGTTATTARVVAERSVVVGRGIRALVQVHVVCARSGS